MLTFCSESLLYVQEENGISMLQQEKNIRTQVEALMKEKTKRMQQLKLLLEQDQDLSDILCSMPYGIAPDSVPSLEQLESFSQHVANQNAEKVGACFVTPTSPQFSYFDRMSRKALLSGEKCLWLKDHSFCIALTCFHMRQHIGRYI